MKSLQKADGYLESRRASKMEFFMNIINGYFCNKSSIIDVRMGYIYGLRIIYVSENIEVFKTKPRWSKSSRFLQRVAFLVLFERPFHNKFWRNFQHFYWSLSISLENMYYYPVSFLLRGQTPTWQLYVQS